MRKNNAQRQRAYRDRHLKSTDEPDDMLERINQMVSLPAKTALIAESLPKGGRSSGFAVFRTFTSIPMIITSLMGGMLMDYYGVLKGCKQSAGCTCH